MGERDETYRLLLALPPTRERIEQQLEPLVDWLYDSAYPPEHARMPARAHAEKHLHDLHLPYVDLDVVCEAFKHGPKVSRTVVSEESDLAGFSPFPELKPNTTTPELILTGKVLEMMLDAGAGHIDVLPCNHSDRPRKTVLRALAGKADAGHVIEALRDYRDSLTRLGRHVTRRRATLAQYGGMWVGHGDIYRVKQGSAPGEMLMKLGAQATAYGFSYDRTQLVAMPHEHRCYEVEADGTEIVLWGLPPCCLLAFYCLGSKPGRYSRFTQWTGWGDVVFDKNGRVVFGPDGSRLVRYRPARLPGQEA